MPGQPIWTLIHSHIFNLLIWNLTVISVGYKTESSSPVKAAVKRKQQELVTSVMKHRRSSITNETAVNLTLTDLSADRSVESCTQDGWMDAQTKAVELRLLLDHERKQSDDFEAYLSRALSGSVHQTSPPSDSSGVSTQESVLNSTDRHCSLSEKISQLQSSLISEREADRLFELQLLQICLYDWVLCSSFSHFPPLYSSHISMHVKENSFPIICLLSGQYSWAALPMLDWQCPLFFLSLCLTVCQSDAVDWWILNTSQKKICLLVVC